MIEVTSLNYFFSYEMSEPSQLIDTVAGLIESDSKDLSLSSNWFWYKCLIGFTYKKKE